jgi:polyphosphate kinase
MLATAAFRVTRNSNLYLQEEESALCWRACAPSSTTAARATPCAWRLTATPPEIVEQLRMNYELDEWQVFRTDGPVNLNRLMNLYSETPRSRSEIPPFVGRELRLHRQSTDMFDELRRGDVLLHHPYDSYDPLVASSNPPPGPAHRLHQADALPHQRRLAHLSGPD